MHVINFASIFALVDFFFITYWIRFTRNQQKKGSLPLFSSGDNFYSCPHLMSDEGSRAEL